MTTQTNPVLVIGKQGKTGARVNALLQARGIKTRAVSRSTTPSFDWTNPATWVPVLRGVKQAYVTFQPDLAIPSAEATLKAFFNTALDEGVEQVVLLSGRGEAGAVRVENQLMESGLRWNIVRASWFYQNFTESFLAESLSTGELTLPVADVLEPFIDCDDIAEVVVAALTDPALSNRLFEVTGPELMTFADCVAHIAAATSRPLEYRYVPLEPYLAHLKNEGLGEDELWLLNELFSEVLDGRNSQIATGVEEALGRKPRRFSEFLEKAIVENAWGSTEAVN